MATVDEDVDDDGAVLTAKCIGAKKLHIAAMAMAYWRGSCSAGNMPAILASRSSLALIS